MAAVGTTENAEFVLQANEIDLVDVQEIGRLAVSRQIVLGELETDAMRVS